MSSFGCLEAVSWQSGIYSQGIFRRFIQNRFPRILPRSKQTKVWSANYYKLSDPGGHTCESDALGLERIGVGVVVVATDSDEGVVAAQDDWVKVWLVNGFRRSHLWR